MNWLKRIFGKENKRPNNSAQNPVQEFSKNMESIKEAGSDDDGHYTDNVETIKQLKRDKKYDEAIEILLKCVDLTENESVKANSKPVLDDKFSFLSEGRTNQWGVAPWYYEQLAIIYRNQKKYADEVAILERYSKQPKAPGVGPQKLAERLVKARELVAKNHA